MMKQEIKEPEKFLRAPIGGIFANLMEAMEDSEKEVTGLVVQMINPDNQDEQYCFTVTCKAITPKKSWRERLNVFQR